MTKFTLQLDLDNDEASQDIIRSVVHYLRDTADSIESVRGFPQGLIWDGNGARIGHWEYTDISLEKRYREIVFLDHEETTDDEGNLITDYALKLVHNKKDDSVVWACPTQEGINEAIGYMLGWDYGDGEISDEKPSAGMGGYDETVEYGGNTYILTYHVGLSHISLYHVTEVVTGL